MKSIAGVKMRAGEGVGKLAEARSFFARIRGWFAPKKREEDRLHPEVAKRIEQSKKDWKEGRRNNFSSPLSNAADIDKWLDTRV